MKLWRIGGDSKPGIFKVQAKASKNGYISASGEASFKVICDTLSRGCPPPPLPCLPTNGCPLALSISVSKNPIVCRNVQTITVTVFDKDSHKPISAANVKVVVMTGFTETNQFSGSTDSAGRISFSLPTNESGTFKIAAQASKDGYSTASGLASFLTRCPPPPRPPSPHGGNNAVAGLSSTLQFQKYFKEFTDMPANSSLYITSTSMHKDTLGNIVITGEIKNNGTNTANFVELIATFYDTSNQTLGNKNTFTEPTTLQPKQAAPFSMYVSPNDTPLNKIDHVKYHLDWQNGSGTANKELPKTGSLKTASSTVHSHITTVRNTGVIQQIPSSKTDFKSGDNSTVKVTFVSSNRDILGNYHVVGNIQNQPQP